jgi:enoyl-CoA hydratase/carnithine racemase
MCRQIRRTANKLPGGGALERLPLLVGRARALEIILGSDDFDAETAAQYGWINRAIPDDELDDFVDAFTRRVASFDKPALAEAKRLSTKGRSRPQKTWWRRRTCFSQPSPGRPCTSAGQDFAVGRARSGPTSNSASGTTW